VKLSEYKPSVLTFSTLLRAIEELKKEMKYMQKSGSMKKPLAYQVTKRKFKHLQEELQEQGQKVRVRACIFR
jgi:hypothetical protein